MPGRLTSNVYLARPVTLSGPSSRLTDVPRTARSAGQLNLGSAGGGGACPPRPPPCAWLATLHPLDARDGFEDARECTAPADVAVEPLLDLFGSGVRVLFKQPDARHHEARRAEAAHQRVLVAERRLDGMQRLAGREAVHRANLLALDVDGERRTRIDRAAVDDHRAGAAGAAIAAPLVAGEIGAHAKRVEQRD